jgi:two-component system alkaline phosphatase synthesis response regulator PhoP
VKRILICDDEPHILEGLRYLLRGPDRTIEVARNGREAIERIDRQVPDLLITDVMMPEMSGLEVVAKLQTQPATRDLPIIILTAKGQAQDAAMAQEVWGASVIAKPFEPHKLRELVTITLENGRCPQTSSTS